MNNPLTFYQQPRRVWYHAKGLFIANTILLLISSVLFGVSLRKGLPVTTLSDEKYASEVYSPALESVEYVAITFNGTYGYPSEYRGPPNPEVDMAWKRITKKVPPIRISEEVYQKIGKPVTRSSVKFQEKDGGGYMAVLEMNHQLHCLNMLRKVTYRDYYGPFDEIFELDPKELRIHLDHCIEMLRQRLMCTSDTGIITYNRIHDLHTPHPDFSTTHRCRNFENILSWSYGHAVHIPEGHVIRFGDEEDLSE